MLRPFIFAKTPRTASNAMHDAFTRTVQHYYEYNINRPVPDDAESSFCSGHKPLSYLVGKYISEGYYKRRFKFACVRNPYDRIVSVWKLRCARVCHVSFDQFVREIQPPSAPQSGHYRLTDPQCRWVLDDFDMVLRYENLETDWITLTEELLLEGLELPRWPSGHNDQTHYSKFYENDDTRERVESLYTDDFKVFSYERIKDFSN